LGSLQKLADQRHLAPGYVDEGLVELLHEWYLAGYLQFPDSED
jgi:hypothetical protein